MIGLRTLHDILQTGRDDDIALMGPSRTAMNYRELRAQMSRTLATLNRLGLGRNDRVAIVLPNGPDMASAFISVACCATTAPLNPAYKRKEFDFYLADLNAKALIVEQGSDSAAIDAARARQIKVLELRTDPARRVAGCGQVFDHAVEVRILDDDASSLLADG